MAKVQVCAILAIFCFCVLNASGLELSSDGSYSIKVGIVYKHDVDISSYVNTIKATLQGLSIKLFISTKEKFFLRSVEILEIPVAGDEDTIPSFQGADIRISDTFQVPHAENPNICGLPGAYIELPLSFFEKRNGGPYGDHAKALLALWARFRWGVWEEHGFPGDAKYPYFYKETSQVAEWAPSGCSNVPLTGKFVNEFDEPSPDCYANKEEALSVTCRFKPNPIQTATSSLMHFHFLESVTEFCDEDTHDTKSPNRQNLFCNYRSIWEVMRTTPDYLKVTRTAEVDLPVVRFQSTTKSEEPVLYILLDKGNVQLEGLGTKITEGLIKLLNALPATTIATVGTYPSQTSESYVAEAISWKRIGDNKAEFESIIRAPRIEAASRNFGLAIQEAAEAIRKRDTLGGAVLLVVKTGAVAGSFGDIAREQDVLADLRTTKLRIFSIELSETAAVPYINLEKFAPEHTVSYTLIKPATIDTIDFVKIAENITITLPKPIPDPAERTSILYKGPVFPNKDLPLLIRSNMSEIYYRLTVPASYDARPVTSVGEVHDGIEKEWAEGHDENRRHVIGTHLTIEDPEKITNGFGWSYYYICPGCENSQGQLLVYGTHAQSGTPGPDGDNLQVTVFTSAVENVLNLNDTANSESPFTIFARATLNEAPVTHLKVTARISEKTGSRNWTITLLDDGVGNPDVLSNDGVYSGTFIPPADGGYTISVQVKNEAKIPETVDLKRFKRSSELLRLIPEDQTEFGCADLGNACGQNNTMDRAFEISSDLMGTLIVVNRADFRQTGRPMNIYTLEAGESVGQQLRLQFMKPGLLGEEHGAIHDITYSIFVYHAREDLLEGTLTPNGTNIRPPAEDSPVQEISLELQDVLEPDDFFVAIKAHNGVLESGLSNIIAIHFEPDTTTQTTPAQTTPTPGTGSTDPSASTSLSGSTDDSSPSSSTDPDVPTTTPEPEEEDKPFFKTGAGIAVIVLIVIVGIAVIGGGIWYFMKRSKKPEFSTA